MQFFNDLFKSKPFFFGFIFLGVNAWTSHMFYHVNSYKIAIFGTFLTYLYFVYSSIPGLNKKEDPLSWQFLLIFALPIIGTLPGLIVHKFSTNYYFNWEFSALLILVLWAGLIYQQLKEESDLIAVIKWIGITIVLTSIWSYLEKLGINPFVSDLSGLSRVKSTFGNINYYAGFLLILIPLFFSLGVPSIQREKEESALSLFAKNQLYFAIIFLLAVVSLFLTQTRSAWAGGALGIAVTGFFLVLFYVPLKYRKVVFLVSVAGLLIFVAGIYLHVSSLENLNDSRIGNVFSARTWEGRLVPWKTAIESIKASIFTGYGLGSSYNLFFEYIDPLSRIYFSQRSYNHAHSEYLEYLQEGGIFGAISWLVFWGLTIFQLIKTAFSKETSDIKKKIAIGIMGGLIAYLIHSIFSVAPRMMVVRLPLYTLMAFAWVISPYQVLAKSTKSHRLQLKDLALGGTIIALFWAVYFPSVYSQYQQIEIMKQPASSQRTLKFEKAFSDSSNIYALDILLREQLRYKRYSQAKKTVAQIQKTIPHFRTVDYFESALEFYTGNYSSAKELGLKHQLRDRYSYFTNLTLARIAVLESDAEAFIKQFENRSQFLIIWNKINDIKEPEQIGVSIQNIDKEIDFIESEKKVEIILSPKFLKLIMIDLKNKNRKKQVHSNEIQKFIQQLVYSFSKSDFFKLKPNLQLSENTRQKVFSGSGQYLRAEQQYQNAQRKRQMDFEKRRAYTPIDKRLEIEKEHNKNMEKLSNSFKKGTEPLIEFMKKNSNWEQFLQRRNLLQEYLKWFNNLAVPSN